ncbi:MAG TPA: hypothetical protein VFK47_17600, partial [Ktedonobacteraceae bacterium]|nr:hypothetical protein [Ktedonobacteraceae bacterium]
MICITGIVAYNAAVILETYPPELQPPQTKAADPEPVRVEALSSVAGRQHLTRRQKWGIGLLAAAGMALDGAAGYYNTYVVPALPDAFHTPTAQEAMVEDMLHTAFDSRTIVRCLPVATLQERLRRQGQPEGDDLQAGVPWAYLIDRPYALMWLRQEVCDGISEAKQALPRGSITEVSVFSLTIAAHEYGHRSGLADEDEAQCFAIQRGSWLALALGATPQVAASVRSYAVSMTEQQIAKGEYGPEYRF